MRLVSVRIFVLLSILASAFEPTRGAAASDRMTIRSHPDVGGKCIDVPYGQFSRGMRVQMWPCNGGPAQSFSYKEESKQLQIGGLCVEAWGRGDQQDAVGLGACNGKPSQQWRMQPSGNYQQILGINDLCGELRYGVKDDGAALDIATCDAARPHRLWAFIASETAPVSALNATDREKTSVITHGLSFGNEKRLEVLPVVFVPSDNTEITEQVLRHVSDLLYANLEFAQRRYQALLKTDTFKIADGELKVYRSKRPNSYYMGQNWPAGGPTDEMEAFTKELFEWNHDSRYDSKYIYLVLYARPGPPVGPGKKAFLGQAYPFNGIRLPNNGFGYGGGGLVGVELSSLVCYYTAQEACSSKKSRPVPAAHELGYVVFQGIFGHELGHALGLTHVNCLGYSMSTNESMMAYNPRPQPEDTLDAWKSVNFNPEEFFALSRNKLAFPNFKYVEAVHNPSGKKFEYVDTCSLNSPMTSYVGAFKRLSSVGFELSINDKAASPEKSAFFTFKEAKESCREHSGAGKNVVCRFNGVVFNPGPAPKLPDLAGTWCDKPGNAPATAEKVVSIAQSGGSVTFKASTASPSAGHFQSNDLEVYDMVWADDWDSGVAAAIRDNGTRLEWPSGNVWLRKPKCGV